MHEHRWYHMEFISFFSDTIHTEFEFWWLLELWDFFEIIKIKDIILYFPGMRKRFRVWVEDFFHVVATLRCYLSVHQKNVFHFCVLRFLRYSWLSMFSNFCMCLKRCSFANTMFSTKIWYGQRSLYMFEVL